MTEQLIFSFVGGGLLCLIAQMLIDLTRLTPARILVIYVSLGVLLFAVGLYTPLFEIFGAGVSLPLVGFGASIADGVQKSIQNEGAIGILKGGLSATSAGITAALLSGLLSSVFFKSGAKRM
jgi:stage V sporulation protein AE